MRSRPPTVTVAAILLVLLSLSDFPWLYQLLFPMTVNHQRLSFTRAMCWALWAS
jgi:hypothetical protein